MWLFLDNNNKKDGYKLNRENNNDIEIKLKLKEKGHSNIYYLCLEI
jgi:hypothetical protein